jgi:hypothetical protein
MPAWITSELRDEVTVPIASAASRTITSRPAWARRRATARPITPAPITTHSTLSIRRSDSQIAGCSTRRVVRPGIDHAYTIALSGMMFSPVCLRQGCRIGPLLVTH